MMRLLLRLRRLFLLLSLSYRYDRRRRHPQELRGDDECTGGRTRKGSARSERNPTAIESHAA